MRVEVEAIAVAPRVEPEGPVKRLGGCQIRHGEHETIQRMHAKGVAAPRHVRLATRDRRHDHPPEVAEVLAHCDDSKFPASAPMVIFSGDNH